MLEEKRRKFGPDCLSEANAAIVIVTLTQLSTRIDNHRKRSNHCERQDLTARMNRYSNCAASIDRHC
jgi:hypothetical protein